jgi:membrane protein implicated in regulation of membrane protease activity
VSLLIAILLAVFVLSPPWSTIVVGCGVLLEIGEIWWGRRLAKRRPDTGVQTLIGREAEVVRALDPTGQVMLDGERWTARAETSIPLGATVVVRSIEGVTLNVAPRARPSRFTP